jgi:ribosomal protein S18 acetylase RimI-like enzyme
MSEFRAERVSPATYRNFWALHGDDACGNWCYCTAWHIETWKGWGQRTKLENKAFREELFASGVRDGYLLLHGNRAIGWCQVTPRDDLPKLTNQFNLPPDETTAAITCLLIHPDHRRSGAATDLLHMVLTDLAARGFRRVEAYPKRNDEEPTDAELWTGPEALYSSLGFDVVQEDPIQPVMACILSVDAHKE